MFFPHFFSLRDIASPWNRQDSPVRLGIMDFLPFSFEAAGVVPLVGGDVCSWKFFVVGSGKLTS